MIPQFTNDFLKSIAEEIMSAKRRELRALDYKRFIFYNGKTKDIILEAINKEFKKPETIEALSARVVPLNIMRKIINKLAGIYIETPERIVANQNEGDQELMESYSDSMKLNMVQKEANRYFKLFKRNLKEIFVANNKPMARNIPRHQYEVFSFSNETPNEADVIVKIIREEIELENCILDVWSPLQYVRINGIGEINKKHMQSLKNDNMFNIYGVMPFVYLNESSNTIDPFADDDLLDISIAMPIVLTDLLFSSKYQAWSIIYTIGAIGDIPVNPNSTIELQYDQQGNKPEIGVVKPSLDSDKVIELVNNIVSMLLSSKGLSVSTIKTGASQNAQETVSGVAKMLDSAENVEGKTDDAEFFRYEESVMWEKVSKYLLPVWMKTKKLSKEYNSSFSPNFSVNLVLREPKVLLSESDLIDIAKKKIDALLSTPRMELSRIYPDANKEELDNIWIEIEEYNSNESKIDEINNMGSDESIVQDRPE